MWFSVGFKSGTSFFFFFFKLSSCSHLLVMFGEPSHIGSVEISLFAIPISIDVAIEFQRVSVNSFN